MNDESVEREESLFAYVTVCHFAWIVSPQMGAAFGRLVGEIASLVFPNGISLSGHANPIVPG